LSTGTKFQSSLEAGELALPAAGRWPDKDCDVPPTKESELTAGVAGKAGKAGLKPEEAPLGDGRLGLLASTPRQPSSLLTPWARPGAEKFAEGAFGELAFGELAKDGVTLGGVPKGEVVGAPGGLDNGVGVGVEVSTGAF
jgi:hypothetical protein